MKLKRKIERVLVLFLTIMILAVTVEAAETIWPANPDNRNWSFEKAREWSDFAYVSENSAELVIGLSRKREDVYARLGHLITLNGGKIVKPISTKKEILAIVAEIPFDSIPTFAEEVKTAGLAKYIEPNLRVQAESLPNDPYWGLQWGPKKIEADWAWNVTVGSSDVLVAIIDSGIDYTHPDLAANYVPLGYDWVDNDTDPMDDYGHGTKVAGVIAAAINNEIGIAGLAQIRIMAEKILNGTGYCYVSWLVDGILHATDQGAKIISLSLSMAYNDPLLYSAVKYAYDAGVLLVAAAGNQAGDTMRYPAAYDEVIAVTATDPDDEWAWWFANFGNWIELAAPGVNIFTTTDWYVSPYGYYDYATGTSMACPYVSGLAALVWSAFPNATRDEVRYLLRNSTDDLGEPGFDEYYGYGRINARKALDGISPEAINHDVAIKDITFSKQNPVIGQTINITVIIENLGNFTENFDVSVNYTLLVDFLIGTKTVTLEAGNTITLNFTWTPPAGGSRYEITAFTNTILGDINPENNVKKAYISVLPNYQSGGVSGGGSVPRPW
jgi:subtilisin family serine protease